MVMSSRMDASLAGWFCANAGAAAIKATNATNFFMIDSLAAAGAAGAHSS
jgi:hypothetical protein